MPARPQLSFSRPRPTRLLALFILPLLCLSTGARAQTLKESLAGALETSRSFRISQHEYEIARQAHLKALISLGPTLSLSASTSDVESKTTPESGGASEEEYETETQSLKLTQKILDQGVKRVGYNNARIDRNIGELSLKEAEARLLRNAAQLHVALYKSRIENDSRGKNVESFEKRLTAIQARFRLGSATQADLAQARALLGVAKANLSIARARLKRNEVRYRSETGLDATSLALPEFTLSLPETIEQAREMMIEQNPQWQIARLQYEKARKVNKLAPLVLAPEIDVTGTVTERQNAGGTPGTTESTTVMLNLSYNLTPFKAFATLKQSAAQKASALEKERNVAEKLEQDLVVLWGDIEAIQSESQARKDARKARKLARDSIAGEARAGVRNPIDLLDAEKDLLDAQIAQIDAEGRLIIARFDLLAITGQLSASHINIAPKQP